MKKEKLFVRLLIAGLCSLMLLFSIGCDQPAPYNPAPADNTYNPAPVDNTYNPAPADNTYTPVPANNTYNNGCPAGAVCQSENPGAYRGKGQYRTATVKLGVNNAKAYYPTDTEGKYGGLVFCPPYLTTQIGFAAWGPWFASHGIALVTMDTYTIMDQVDQRDDEQWNVVKKFKQAAGGKLANLDPNRVGVIGWSMGGGATWINAGKHSGELKMAISLAGHNMTAMARESKGHGITIPTLLLNGATDYTILGGMGQSEGVYRNVQAPKVLCVTFPAGHFSWSSPTSGGAGVAELALAFTKTYLYDDTRWKSFITKPRSAQTWRTEGIN